MTFIDIGIPDGLNLWDWSVGIDGIFITIRASSPRGIDNGWYRAVIGTDGSFLSEQRMLASGDYDYEPSTNRPHKDDFRRMLAKIPASRSTSIQAIKVAFDLQ